MTTEKDDEKDERGPLFVLDGANMAWHMGYALAKRYDCTPRPLSFGVLLALRSFGSRAIAFLPADMVEGPMHKVADGRRSASSHSGAGVREADDENIDNSRLELVASDASASASTRLWRNRALSALVASGRAVSVPRNATLERSSDDDVALIRFARRADALIVSNDVFRDHGRRCTMLPRRGAAMNESATLGFTSRKNFKRFMKHRRIGFEVLVHGAPPAMYPEGHPISVAASEDDLAAIPELFAEAAKAGGLERTDIASFTKLSRFSP